MNAETVTTIATSFLKRIGHKSGVKPKRATLEEEAYIVEIDTKNHGYRRVDADTHEIKGYEIQPKGEKTSFISISPKIIAVTFGISAVVYVTSNFAFQMFGV